MTIFELCKPYTFGNPKQKKFEQSPAKEHKQKDVLLGLKAPEPPPTLPVLNEGITGYPVI